MDFGSSSTCSGKLEGMINGEDRVEGAPSSSTMGSIQQSVSKKRLTALIVDDDGVSRRIHQLVLNTLGVESQEAGNGKEAVDLCIAGKNFDLILMAMKIPIYDGSRVSIHKLWRYNNYDMKYPWLNIFYSHLQRVILFLFF